MGRECDVKRVGLEVASDTKCRFERPPLWSRQPPKLRKNLMKELMQARESELGLGFDTHRRERPEPGGNRTL
jgi:hypothetical protein